MIGNYWYRRFVSDLKRKSQHIKIKPIKLGFVRIYWDNNYMHEVPTQMPPMMFDHEVDNPMLENKKYYQEYEDTNELIKKVKNYTEGYYDSMARMERRIYMHRTDKDYNIQLEQLNNTFNI